MARFGVLFVALTIISIAECRNLKYNKRKRAAPGDGEQEQERREVCIEDMGCFDTNPGVEDEGWSWASMNAAMEDNLMRDSRRSIGVQFRWWAPGAKEAKVITNFDFKEKFGEGFEAALKVKFIIHGYNGGEAEWPLIMKDAFMRKEPQCNVFIVDWSNGDGFMYQTAVANTWVVGAEMGHFIIQLVEEFDVKLEDIHIIGHSLGAHTSGYAGKWVKDRLLKTVGRITGLDPAGPEFYDEIPGERLDMGDASFVDVIHTNWASYTLAGLGLFDPVGHFDFYPNGGEEQPGCKSQSEALFAMDDNSVDDFACSHSRAIDLFTESIESEPCQFLADQCTSWEGYTEGKCPPGGTLRVQMGYHADEYQPNIDAGEHKSFFLYTNAETPYCKA